MRRWERWVDKHPVEAIVVVVYFMAMLLGGTTFVLMRLFKAGL